MDRALEWPQIFSYRPLTLKYCNVLRDQCVSYGDYVEQLTCVLFLKIADEQSKSPFNKPSIIPIRFDWQSLLSKDDLERESLEDSENLPAPEVIAREIVENLEAALEQFRGIEEELNGK